MFTDLAHRLRSLIRRRRVEADLVEPAQLEARAAHGFGRRRAA